MKHVSTKTTYLEMRARPHPRVTDPREDVTVRPLQRPHPDEYRFLYNSVGRDYQWIDRNLLSDDDLTSIIQHDRIEIYVLSVNGETAGFAELDCRREGEVELAYFGLFPAFVGRGMGKYFLAWTLDKAWSHAPDRVWLHTCDLDHPAALPNYLKAGFVIYDERTIEQVVEGA